MLEAFHIEKERQREKRREGGRLRKLALPQLILRQESPAKSMQTGRLNAQTLGQQYVVYCFGSKLILLLMGHDMVTSVLCSKSDVSLICEKQHSVLLRLPLEEIFGDFSIPSYISRQMKT